MLPSAHPNRTDRRRRRQGFRWPALFAGSLAVALSLVAGPLAAAPKAGVVAVFKDFQAWKSPPLTDGYVDYGPAALAARGAALEALLARLEAMPAQRWPIPDQVDWLTVRALVNEARFIHAVTRPWHRDPVFYVQNLLPLAFDAPREHLDEIRAIPAMLAAARVNLDAVAADYADLAIEWLTESDGVENGYPARDTAPPGVIGWYEDLLGRAAGDDEAVAVIAEALEALRGFHRWLVDNRASMTAPNGVGHERLDWFVQHALLLPWTSAEMAVLSERELDRMWAFYALERHRNRGLPELTLASSAEDYHRRLAATDALVRGWLEGEDFISIPDYIPGDWRELGYNVPFVDRGTPPNFWEQVQYRDPVPDHLHAVIPGHRFDAIVSGRIDHPIRSQVNFGARWQGWAVYLEEAPLQAGILEAHPRARELIYVFGLWRAARSLGDIRNQWNELSAAETAAYWQEVTPLMDRNVARKYAYLRPSPGHGLEDTLGNIQMFRLLSRVKQRERDAFDLRRFHDTSMAKGRIPVALIDYEMTGDPAVVEGFWRTPAIP